MHLLLRIHLILPAHRGVPAIHLRRTGVIAHGDGYGRRRFRKKKGFANYGGFILTKVPSDGFRYIAAEDYGPNSVAIHHSILPFSREMQNA